MRKKSPRSFPTFCFAQRNRDPIRSVDAVVMPDDDGLSPDNDAGARARDREMKRSATSRTFPSPFLLEKDSEENRR